MDEATIQRLGAIIARHLAVEREKLLDPEALAERLRVTVRQVYKLVRQGRIPPGVLVGRSQRRWRWSEVERALRRPTRRRRPAAGRAGEGTGA